MFFVLNKQKLYSYGIAIATVAILFGLAIFLSSEKNAKMIQTSNYINRQLPIYYVDTPDQKVSITINCAWSAEDVDLILQTLQKHQVKATFFMVGDWVDKYPEAVQKIAKAGCEIGNHSNTHPHVTNLSYEKNVEQIKRCSDKIEKITGKPTTLYRGPYGEYNDTVIKAAKSLNHQSIQWNIDTLDYKGLTGKEMMERINEKLTKGSIILMHNGTKYTAESLDMIITNIKEKGYTIVPVSELIYSEEKSTIDANGMQKREANE